MSRAKALRSKRRKAWPEGAVAVAMWRLSQQHQREHAAEHEAALARMRREMRDMMGLSVGTRMESTEVYGPAGTGTEHRSGHGQT